MQQKRISIIALMVAAILLIPFIAMQFTTEVNWKLNDFVIAGILLFSTGLLIDYILRKVKGTEHSVIYIVILLFIFLLTWAELAVGIFGTPFAGS